MVVGLSGRTASWGTLGLVGCSFEGVSCFEGVLAVFVHVHPDDNGIVDMFEVDAVHVEVGVGIGGGEVAVAEEVELAFGARGNGGEAGMVSELAEVAGDECAVIDGIDGGHFGWGSDFEAFEDHGVA